MMTSRKKRNLLVSLLAVSIAVVVFILSYCFVFEAYYITPEVIESDSKVENIEIYAILNDEGTFDIYFDDTYIETVDSLEMFPVDKVYNMKGEIINEN